MDGILAERKYVGASGEYRHASKGFDSGVRSKEWLRRGQKKVQQEKKVVSCCGPGIECGNRDKSGDDRKSEECYHQVRTPKQLGSLGPSALESAG